jgi:hypothetical protein
MRGNFTVNEGHLSDFNLASFQPGFFWEADLISISRQRIVRFDYNYGLDFFGGDRLADRHGLLGSLITIDEGDKIDYCYGSIAFSNFESDGTTPSVQSLDGPVYSVGAARFFLTQRPRIPTWTLGSDLEISDSEGDDFRYQSVRAYSDLTLIVLPNVTFIPSGAVGYRHFPDFTGLVNRDELTGRIGGRLKYQIRPCFSVSAVVNYDRFASDNESFDVDRFTSGIMAAYNY